MIQAAAQQDTVHRIKQKKSQDSSDITFFLLWLNQPQMG